MRHTYRNPQTGRFERAPWHVRVGTRVASRLDAIVSAGAVASAVASIVGMLA